jgi:hypothetical protein
MVEPRVTTTLIRKRVELPPAVAQRVERALAGGGRAWAMESEPRVIGTLLTTAWSSRPNRRRRAGRADLAARRARPLGLAVAALSPSPLAVAALSPSPLAVGGLAPEP